MRIKKRNGAVFRFNSSAIAKAIMKAMNQTTEEIEVKRSALCQLIAEVVETQIEEHLKRNMENARDEFESQIHNLRDRLRKLRAFYNRLIYGNDSNFSKVLNFLKRIWSRAKAVIEVILFIEGIHDTIVRVMNMIFPQNASSLKEYAFRVILEYGVVISYYEQGRWLYAHKRDAYTMNNIFG